MDRNIDITATCTKDVVDHAIEWLTLTLGDPYYNAQFHTYGTNWCVSFKHDLDNDCIYKISISPTLPPHIITEFKLRFD